MESGLFGVGGYLRALLLLGLMQAACTSRSVTFGQETALDGRASGEERTVELSAWYVNQDTPTNNRATSLLPPLVVYGGSEASTSDKLDLHAFVPRHMDGTAFQWSVTGPPGATYTPPAVGPAAWDWNVGRVFPVPGAYVFSVVATFSDGTTASASATVQVGIRTDDVIAVGWIDPTLVTIPAAAGVTARVAANFPAAGPPVPNSIWCNFYLLQLSQFVQTPFLKPILPPDRPYLVNWLFKYAANPDPSTVIPGGDFRDATNTMIDYTKVNAYKGTATNYKMYNRLQVKFLVGAAGFAAAPAILQQSVGIGTTVPPVTNPIKPNFPGQAGPANGLCSSVAAGLTPVHVSLINDGSPAPEGINAYNTLTGGAVPAPVFWEDIGSQVRFTWNGGTNPSMLYQPYPTYNIYQNGTLVKTNPQAASPYGNFSPTPYPFGTVVSGTPLHSIPGGRNGIATLPADITARVPPSGYATP